MRAPSLLAQCLPGLAPQDKGSQSVSVISDRDVHLSSPAVEILPSRVYFLLDYFRKSSVELLLAMSAILVN